MVLSLKSEEVKPARRVGRRKSAGGGFTLVEVMVATVLLSMIILGILAVLIGSYRVAAKARYADQARYVIKSFADQFLTQQPLDSNGNTLTLFQPTVDSTTVAAPRPISDVSSLNPSRAYPPYGDPRW